jgi:hypothetical protein
MDKVWQNLPYDIVREILRYVTDIDVRLAFKICPGKIDQEKAISLWNRLTCHDGIIYNLETTTLHYFENGMYSNRRPINITYIDKFTCLFNEFESPYNLEIVYPNGTCIGSSGHTEPIFTSGRVLFKGLERIKSKWFFGTKLI